MCYTMKMTESLTVGFSGTESVLRSDFLPEITLDADCDYSCALLDLIIKNKSDADLKKIVDLNVIRVNCDIISGSYINGQQSHAIHQFATGTTVVKSHKSVKKQPDVNNQSSTSDQTIVEIPKNLNYLLVKIKSLRTIQISLVDQSGNPVDIGGGVVFCRINIKKDKKFP